MRTGPAPAGVGRSDHHAVDRHAADRRARPPAPPPAAGAGRPGPGDRRRLPEAFAAELLRLFEEGHRCFCPDCRARAREREVRRRRTLGSPHEQRGPEQRGPEPADAGGHRPRLLQGHARGGRGGGRARGRVAPRPPDDELLTYPLADGGEGTLDALGHDLPADCWRSQHVTGPDGRPVEAAWLLLPDGTAVVEMAARPGSPAARARPAARHHPRARGAAGRRRRRPAVQRVMLTLGGSATTDGGTGAWPPWAPGSSTPTVPTCPRAGARWPGWPVSTSAASRRPRRAACSASWTSPPRCSARLGAAGQFGPQKGASPEQVAQLDAALARLADLLDGDREAPGSGAAGGTAFGFAACWGAVFVSGQRVRRQRLRDTRLPRHAA